MREREKDRARVQVMAGAGASAREAAEQLRRGEDELRRVLETYQKAAEAHKAGRAAEVWHAATFNADAALKGSVERATTTASVGLPTSPADIRLAGAGGKATQVQVKYHGTADSNVAHLSRQQYRSMQKVVPSDQVADIKKIAAARADSIAARRPVRAAELRDTATRASDRIVGKQASSKPLSSGESRQLVADPGKLGRMALTMELASATKAGAASGAAFGAGVSVIAHAKQMWDGNEDLGAAALSVGKDAARSALSGAATSAGGAVVKAGLMRAGAQGLARGAAPVAIASSALEAGGAVFDLARGEIDGRECGVKVAKAAGRGAACWGGAEAGAAIGTLICPGVGTAIGGVVGGLAAALGFGALFD